MRLLCWCRVSLGIIVTESYVKHPALSALHGEMNTWNGGDVVADMPIAGQTENMKGSYCN